jgi:hypothetical protein
MFSMILPFTQAPVWPAEAGQTGRGLFFARRARHAALMR